MKTRGREFSLPLVFESSISDQPSLCRKILMVSCSPVPRSICITTELPVLILILRSEWFSICWKQPIFIVCPFSRFPAIKPPPLLVLHLSRCPGKFRSTFTKFKLLSSLSRRERFFSVSSISGTIFQYASDSLSALYSSHTLTNAG